MRVVFCKASYFWLGVFNFTEERDFLIQFTLAAKPAKKKNYQKKLLLVVEILVGSR